VDVFEPDQLGGNKVEGKEMVFPVTDTLDVELSLVPVVVEAVCCAAQSVKAPWINPVEALIIACSTVLDKVASHPPARIPASRIPIKKIPFSRKFHSFPPMPFLFDRLFRLMRHRLSILPYSLYPTAPHRFTAYAASPEFTFWQSSVPAFLHVIDK
jgi:hypothetical protein